MHHIFDLVASSIAKSNELLVLADALEWENFSMLAVQRQRLVTSINVGSIELSAADNDRLHELINQLLVLNVKLEIICQQQRSETASELQKIRQGNKVSKAYSQ
jgi:hypothetical protein